MEERLTKAFWTRLERPTTSEFSSAAKPELKPQINLPPPAPAPATAAKAEWVISQVTTAPQWRTGFYFKLRNFSKGDPVRGLSAEEIEAARKSQSQDVLPKLDEETV
jgi:hypothetical protein